MKRSLVPAILVTLMVLTSLSCSKLTPPGPTQPQPGGGGGGGNSNGPMILAAVSRGTVNGTVSGQVCEVTLTDKNGNLLTGGAATLIAPGNVSVALTEAYSGFFEDLGNGWTYQPGQTYSIHVSYSGKSYSSSLALPGGITVPASGTPISWAYEGNQDVITVLEQFSPYTYWMKGPDAQSPVNASAGYPMAGSYLTSVNVIKAKISAFTGAYVASSFIATDQYEASITK